MSVPAYPAYRASGSALLGAVPQHWPIMQIKRFARLAYGDALPTEARNDAGDVPVFGSNGPVGVHDNANARAPVIVVGRKGSYGALNWSNAPVFAIDTAYFVDASSAACNLRWLLWAFHAANLGAFSQDTGVPGLARELVHDLTFVCPPPAEQSAIAAFLDRETGKIDALVAEQERLIALLKEKRQAVISQAVTKGLDPNAPMKDSGVEWFGEVPAHWDVVPLMWLTQPARPIMYGIVLPGPDVEQGIPIMKGGNVKPSRLNLESMARTTAEIEAPYARARLRRGDLVYSIRGSIGDCEIVPEELEGSNITQDVARVAPRSDIDPEWLRFALLSAPVREALASGSLGAAVRGINIFDLKRAQIATPPEAERRQIADHLRSSLSALEGLSAEAERAVGLLKERRAALISAAVTGKIDVRGLVTPEEAKAA